MSQNPQSSKNFLSYRDIDHLPCLANSSPDSLEISDLIKPESHRNDILHSPTFRISTSVKSLWPHQRYILLFTCSVSCAYFCSNHALVTIDSFSLNWPKNCGLSAMTTTAFCTVLLVTSGGLRRSSLASICRVHEMPKMEVGALFSVAFRRRVK